MINGLSTPRHRTISPHPQPLQNLPTQAVAKRGDEEARLKKLNQQSDAKPPENSTAMN